jgi:hypothetical protein
VVAEVPRSCGRREELRLVVHEDGLVELLIESLVVFSEDTEIESNS